MKLPSERVSLILVEVAKVIQFGSDPARILIIDGRKSSEL